MNIVEELRSKKSRDNRELLDKAADIIEELKRELIKYKAKDLCEKSTCHHKCPDTDKCVVEDDALLLINQDKINNFDVKSNNELFKQALVEGVNRHIDKTIEEEKQIEEIIIDLLTNFDEMGFVPTTPCPDPEAYAIEWKEKLTKALKGYRNQSEGEWIKHGYKYQCTQCKVLMDIDGTPSENLLHYCPNCGAKMKGGE